MKNKKVSKLNILKVAGLLAVSAFAVNAAYASPTHGDYPSDSTAWWCIWLPYLCADETK